MKWLKFVELNKYWAKILYELKSRDYMEMGL